MEKTEATKLMTRHWLLIPFVPTKGIGRNIMDYGDFLDKISEVRPSQKVTLFGHKKKNLSENQMKIHGEYVKFVQNFHRIPDSLVFSLIGDYDARILVTPIIFSHQVSRTKEGIFQRRMAIVLKAWEIESRKIILEVSSASIHSSAKKEKLVSGDHLFKAGLEALSEKLLYQPLAGLTPASRPDY